MARGTTLVKLLDTLRAEAGLSLNPAHNNQIRESHVNLLQRTQERLWQDFAWPHLRVYREVKIAAGQRYYDFPADLDIERIEHIELFRDGCWGKLSPGIGGNHYGAWNSDLDQRTWPPQRWRLAENDDFEIWPIADIAADPVTRDGYLKITGIRTLKPLVDDGDRADLDDRILTLFAAAELLARAKAPDAQIKLDSANRIYARLRGGLMQRSSFSMFGTGNADTSNRRRTIAHYRPAGS